MWIGVLWAGLRVAMWITHVDGKFRHGLLEKSLIFLLQMWGGGGVVAMVFFRRLRNPGFGNRKPRAFKNCHSMGGYRSAWYCGEICRGRLFGRDGRVLGGGGGAGGTL